MTDSCMICETEPVENTGWFIAADNTFNSICPWCIKDFLAAKEFSDRCKKDGILTYDRDCDEGRKMKKLAEKYYDDAVKLGDYHTSGVLGEIIKESKK